MLVELEEQVNMEWGQLWWRCLQGTNRGLIFSLMCSPGSEEGRDIRGLKVKAEGGGPWEHLG